MANKNSKKGKKRSSFLTKLSENNKGLNIKVGINTEGPKWKSVGEIFVKRGNPGRLGGFGAKRLVIRYSNRETNSPKDSSGSGSANPPRPSKGSRSTGPKRY